uniref:Uncharacterized protein n=1 Tax=Sphaerodactylus townsendi TaxID=933632 RepID=A0ACB8FE30_9SAUR
MQQAGEAARASAPRPEELSTPWFVVCSARSSLSAMKSSSWDGVGDGARRAIRRSVASGGSRDREELAGSGHGQRTKTFWLTPLATSRFKLFC